MKKRYPQRSMATLLLLCLLLSLGTGCSSTNNGAPVATPTTSPTNAPADPSPVPTETPKYDTALRLVDDNYRNYYEVFVASYCDSDQDGYGDLKGLASKLDYIQDMGFTGIWLMPIHPSPSYHKYDVTDYYAIDPQYGTLEDFELFLSEAHARGIHVILDLVVNHSSNQHPWFQDGKNGPSSPYFEYYNFQETAADGYNKTGSYYFESRFGAGMPDLNLDSEAVRAEIVSIMKFWLELGVDGFRLDAVTSYYTDQKSKNIEFLSWLNTEAKAIAPDCYIIGECWDSLDTISDYYASGVDSFFCFAAAQASGYLAQLVIRANVAKPAQSFADSCLLLQEEISSQGILAPFLDNHDTNRIASGLYAIEDDVKLAAGLLAMMNGSIFVYYGDELGFTGEGIDQNKRIAMKWEPKVTATRHPTGTTEAEYPFGSVQEQSEDENSILNYYRHAMFLRNQNPELARGTVSFLPQEDDELCVMQKTWENSTITVVINFAAAPRTLILDLAEIGAATITGELCAYGECTYNEADGMATLALPGYAIAIFR